ncbi:MAG: AAA family ATPase [Moorea sp. SIO3C2]|nr:AAA family ATPase [Moorena sp. SIO3C2]
MGFKSGDRVELTAHESPIEGIEGARSWGVTLPEQFSPKVSEWDSEQRGIHIYTVIGGRKGYQTTHARALFFEYDPPKGASQDEIAKSKERCISLWQKFGLPEPTFQVDNGGKSIHTYWVFHEPQLIPEWQELQKDIAKLMDGDGQLWKSTQTMRLPGTTHWGYGGIGRIVQESGVKYSFQELRSLVPPREKTKPNQKRKKPRWNEFKELFIFPCSDSPPLTGFVSEEAKGYIDSGTGDYRNGTGAMVARSILGASRYLDQIGQSYAGDPRQLFLDYCQRCGQGHGWDEREWESIWQSAFRDKTLSPMPSEDAIRERAAWHCFTEGDWEANSRESFVAKTISSMMAKAAIAQPKKGATEDEKLDVAIANYSLLLAQRENTKAILLKGAIKRDFSISEWDIKQLLEEHNKPDDSTGLDGIEELACEVMMDLSDRSSNPSKRSLIPTKFKSLARIIGGYEREAVSVWGARPKMGKTIALSEEVLHIASQGYTCLFFTAEMAANKILYRMLASASSVPESSIRTASISEGQWEALMTAEADIEQYPIYFDDSKFIHINEVVAKARWFAENVRPVDFIGVDYVQLLDHSQRDKKDGVEEIMKGLKGLAASCNCHVQASAQVGRWVDKQSNKRPGAGDLSDSDAIAKYADLIMTIYRDEVYNPEGGHNREVEAIVCANRLGPTGTAKLLFEAEYTRMVSAIIT